MLYVIPFRAFKTKCFDFDKEITIPASYTPRMVYNRDALSCILQTGYNKRCILDTNYARL